MPSGLRDVTRDFSRGVVTLGAWRAAAQAERVDRNLADRILALIAEWETTAWPDTGRARKELRARAEQLVPAAPPAAAEPPSWRGDKDPTAAMYDAGLRGHKRQE